MRKLLAACLFPCLLLAAPRDEPTYKPHVAAASDEAEKALQRFRTPPGAKLSVFAAEPHLANPVAFAVDEKGRFFVAETFRLHKGVTDNRGHMYWLDDELACRTVADRVAMYRKHLKNKFADYEKEHDRVRLVVDADGDGKADQSSVFADGFNSAADGLGSGVLARQGNVYFTCIPHLWLLRDTKNTGTADVRRSLADGFGVHVAFIGHDLHGLRLGPDGRLYFTCGDRGLNVKTKEGKHLFLPDTGAVLRCEPDGANLEVVAWGLRNPQELAFDDYGNLFTIDNNSDAGDQARLVHLVEGGDSGWRMGYQYGSALHDDRTRQGNRGPWHYEKLWHLRHDGQAAYHLPPLAHFTAGPSGLCAYPGVGLSDKFAGRFFVCDFRGQASGSGVWSFRCQPKGATFELNDPQKFVWDILATDCDFGPDSAFYVSDWVHGWGLTGKGRIYKLVDPEAQKNPAVAEAKQLLAAGFAQRPRPVLAKLLGHPHQQVRQEAQFALAAQGKDAVELLTVCAKAQDTLLARIHALWALGQIGRKEPKALEGVVALLQDPQAEIRAQTARVLGEANQRSILGALAKATRDAEPRVRFFAAQSLGKVAGVQDEAFQAVARADLERVLRTNSAGDLYLRHAAVAALARIPLIVRDVDLSSDTPAGVRLGLVLALRRQGNPEVARFLHDADAAIVAEAARAIHDEPIRKALPELAALLDGSPDSEKGLRRLLQAAKPVDPTVKPLDAVPTLFRALDANFRLGQQKHADAIAKLAARDDMPELARKEALRLLAEWPKPSGRDRVTGLWRPVTEDRAGDSPAERAADAFRAVMPRLFTGSEVIRSEATKTASRLGIKEVGPTLHKLLADSKMSARARADALTALAGLRDAGVADAIEAALKDEQPALRREARRLLAERSPVRGVQQLLLALEQEEATPADFTPEQRRLAARDARQSALAVLARMNRPDAQAVVEQWLDKLLAKQVAPELHLDVLEAARLNKTATVTQKLKKYEATLAPYAEALEGGDAARGELLFYGRAELSCVRCHKIKGEGGEVGPDLTGIAGKQKRDYLLEALVQPSKTIAKGFETVILTTTQGKQILGIVKKEDAERVELMTAEGKLISVAKKDIEERQAGKSSMPEDLLKHVTKFELRDLVEFLASLK